MRENHLVEDETLVLPLKPAIRRATPADERVLQENKKKEQEAFDICHQKIEKYQLDMKLTEVEYTFDNSKILFYFTSDQRVDFRELVKDLAATFHTRIELRQIGVRDESKMLGGLGICGRPFCCSTYMGEFVPVSIKMAKEQGLSLNPTKISGVCGRLMCCLKYEQYGYEEFAKITPKVGSRVLTKEGAGVVTEANVITGVLKVSLSDSENAAPKVFHRDEVSVVREHQKSTKDKGKNPQNQ